MNRVHVLSADNEGYLCGLEVSSEFDVGEGNFQRSATFQALGLKVESSAESKGLSLH